MRVLVTDAEYASLDIEADVLSAAGHELLTAACRTAEAAALSAHLQQVRAMTKEYASPGVLKRVAAERHGHPMGTVRPPLVAVPTSFDARAAAERAAAAPAA